MKRLPALLLLVAARAFAADASAPPKPFTATLQPKAMHEECVKLDASEKRKYYWKADNAVDFNIHYHDGKEVFYPLKRDGTRVGKGTFRAKIAQDYCWMWTAHGAPAKVEGRISK